MYMSILYLLFLSCVLPAASAAPNATFKPSISVSPPTDNILERPASPSGTPESTLTLTDTTLTNSSDTSDARRPIIIPIAGIFLRITHVADETWFTSSILNRLMTSAHQSIQHHIVWRPDAAVAPLPWFHKLYDKQWRDTLAIRVRGNEGRAITWLQLHWVLVGLQGFMEGDPVQLHPVNFDVAVGGEHRVVAAGVLWYSDRHAQAYPS